MLERTPDFPRMTTSIVSGRDLAQGTVRLPETLRAVDAQVHPDLIIVCGGNIDPPLLASLWEG